MDIKPIRTKNDYKQALKQIEQLFDAKPNSKEGDILDIVTTLVEKYEEKNFPIESPDPIEALLFYMEKNNMVRADLKPYIGSRARVSEVINKKRNLTLPMIRKLYKELHIPAHILIQDYNNEHRV